MTAKMLFELKPGDRFYYVGDPRKTVIQIRELVMKGRYINKEVVQYVIFSDLKEGHSNRAVVFLRNINETT